MKVVRTVLLNILFILFLAFCLFADESDTLWTKTFGGSFIDVGNSVQECDSGGFIVVGNTRSFGSGAYDVYLIRTDVNGNPIWTTTFGGSGNDYGRSVQECDSGSFIVAGYTDSYGAGGNDVYLRNFSISKTYGGVSDDYGYSVQKCASGGFIIAGQTFSYGSGSGDIYLVRTDENGDSLWTKTYGGVQSDCGNYIQECTSGGFIISGYTYSLGAGESDVYFIRTDANGDTLWTKTYGGADREFGNSVQECKSGGFIIAGTKKHFGATDYDVYLIRTDANGDTLWTKTYGGAGDDLGNSVQECALGGFIIGARTYSFGAGSWDVYLIRTDENGDTLWTKTYGGIDADGCQSVQECSSLGFIIAGSTRSFGAGESDVYLIRTIPLDSTPPIIDSTTIWSDTTYAGPFPVFTKVTDEKGVETVRLYFKRIEDPSWFSIEMIEQTSDWYYGEIPQAYQPNDTIKYYIYASDLSQHEATDPDGAPGNFYSFIANIASGLENKNEKLSPVLKNAKIYPNPFMNIVSIKWRSRVKIYDCSGRFIADVNSSWTGRNFKGEVVESGIYFLLSEGRFIGKVIKLK